MKYIFHEPAAYCRWRKCLLVMKLTLVLLIAFVLHAGARGTAQTVTLSVKDMPLEKVCKEIERQTGYYFVYTKDMNKDGQLVTLNVDHAAIEKTLLQVFSGLPFGYQIIDKVIVINTIKSNLPPGQIDSSSAAIRIEGEVLNEQRQPLDGATIMVKSSGKTTLTNNKGQFHLDNIITNSVLVVSYIGYATKMVVAKQSGHSEIILSLATNALDETVIKGYYATSNRLNTGNVSVVKGVDIQKQPVTDPLLALEGRVPGLYIQQTSGIPGAYSSIFLRGQNSVFNPYVKLGTVNDPLFVIDGIPYSTQSLTNSFFGGGAVGTPGTGESSRGTGLSPFNNINTADIERIEVLKDADATAIYGARGANGVILITTKKGKAGITKFDVNVFSGGGMATRRIPLLNTKQYLAMRQEALRNDGLQVGDGDYDLNGTWDTTRYTDWQKVLIGNMAKFTNAQLNISGGNANTQFAIGAGYSTQGTLYPGTYHDNKTSASLSMTHISSDRRFNANAAAHYVYNNNNLPQIDLASQIAFAPDAPPLYDADGNLNWQIKNGIATFRNPLRYTTQSASAFTHTLVGNLSVSYRLFPSVELKNNIGYTRGEMNQTLLSPSTYQFPPFNNLDPNRRTGNFATSETQTSIIEPQVSFRQKIGNGIFEALVGSTIQQSHNHSIVTGSSGYISDELMQNPLNAKSFALYQNSYSDYRYNALYGRISYNWQDKYLINITGRRDGSSRFGPSKQFGNFGAIGAGWIFSSEPFFEKWMSVVSFGKLRASYGTTGNDGIQDYQYMSTYVSNSSTYQGVTSLAPARIPNPYFAWESVKKWEGGLELGVLKDRIMFTLSYYRNRSGNQLTAYPLPNIAGFNLVQENLPAVIQNTGVEITLNAMPIKTREFNWNFTANLSIPRNKLVAFPNLGSTAYNYVYVVGKSLFINNVYHSTGVDPQTGVYTFATKKGGGTPAMEDLIYVERGQQLYGGVQNSFTYRGWEMDIFIQLVKQTRSTYQGAFTAPGYFVYFTPTQNQPVWVLDRWQSKTQQSSVQKFSTSLAAQNAYNFLNSSDATIIDASFLRVKNVALSYQFSRDWLKKVYMQSARLYLQCQNLFTISKYRGMDPETGGIGLPPLRMITIGAQFSL